MHWVPDQLSDAELMRLIGINRLSVGSRAWEEYETAVQHVRPRRLAVGLALADAAWLGYGGFDAARGNPIRECDTSLAESMNLYLTNLSNDYGEMGESLFRNIVKASSTWCCGRMARIIQAECIVHLTKHPELDCGVVTR